MKKILVINVNWLGDVIFSTPALKALRKSNPQAYLACLVVSRCEEVLKNNPTINEVIIYDEYGKHRSIFGKMKFILSLRKKKFDEAYVFHPSLKRAMISYLAGIPKRIGYNTKRRSFLLTQAVPVPVEPTHKIDYFLQLLQASGIKTEDRACDFFFNPEDVAFVDNLLKQSGIKENEKFVVINPGGNWLLKRWPTEYFAELAERLIEKAKVKVVIVGAKKDIELAQKVQAIAKNKTIIFSGQTTLAQLGALMQRSSCVVSADSGPMHIAACVGANTVAIFGPTSAEFTGPSGKARVVILQKDIGCEVPCYVLDCRDNRCMKAITPQEVFEGVCNFLA